jgi:hypothetical protein
LMNVVLVPKNDYDVRYEYYNGKWNLECAK